MMWRTNVFFCQTHVKKVMGWNCRHLSFYHHCSKQRNRIVWQGKQHIKKCVKSLFSWSSSFTVSFVRINYSDVTSKYQNICFKINRSSSNSIYPKINPSSRNRNRDFWVFVKVFPMTLNNCVNWLLNTHKIYQLFASKNAYKMLFVIFVVKRCRLGAGSRHQFVWMLHNVPMRTNSIVGLFGLAARELRWRPTERFCAINAHIQV